MPTTISIITPSFNQARFLPQTLASVLDQGYGGLEYIIMDGGSTDGSTDIIKTREHELSFWQSQPDGGQYAAINAGFARSTGDIMGWLNSDDMLTPRSLWVIGEIFNTFPEVDWITGLPALWDGDGSLAGVVERAPIYARKCLVRGEHDARFLPGIQQESCFWRRSLWEKAGGRLNTYWELAADFDLWVRFAEYADLWTVATVLGGSRRHPGQKTARRTAAYFADVDKIAALAGQRRCRLGLASKLRRLPVLGNGLARLFFPQRGGIITWEGHSSYDWKRDQRRVTIQTWT